MIYFNLKEAKIFQAVKWERSPIFKFPELKKKFFLILFIFIFLIFLYGFLTDSFSPSANSRLLGLSIISLVFTVTCWIKEIFFNSKLRNPKIEGSLEESISQPERFNLADFLDFEAGRTVLETIIFSKKRELSKIPSEALLYFILNPKNPKIGFIFARGLLNLKEIKDQLGNYLDSLKGEKFTGEFSPDFQKVILEAAGIAYQSDRETIGIGDILAAQTQVDPIFKKAMIDSNLKKEDIENLVWWSELIEKEIGKSKKFWEYENLVRKGSIAKDWAAGYTITLDQFSIDWTEVIKKRGFEEIVGHKESLEHLERTLARPEVNDALLIGEPGAGRKSIIHALAHRAFLGQSLPEINYKRIVELDIVSILAHFKSTEEVAQTLDTIFQEVVSAGNVILVIDEFYNFVTQTDGRLGGVDITGILSRYLPLPEFRLIGITSYHGLHLFIEKNPTILEYMEKVEIKEVSEKETILILEDRTLFLENKYKKFVPYQTIRDIVKYSARYIQEFPFPKKAIDLLDGILVYTSRYAKSPLVLPEYVAKVVSEITDIPLGEIEIKEREILLSLENLIHQRIINQEEAVKEVSTALRRARADITVRKGPMGCFLFLGPTGVGKTETSKALAEIYFGSENRMIRLDMSEFQAIKDIPRLIGSAEEEGLLTTKVREDPFSLILLDEFEKAHPNILNLFLQVFDEGHLTDGLGRKVDFKNTIIIATSNAGYQIILDALKRQADWSEIKGKLLDYLFEKAIFRPELINRFDSVVLFKPLTKENLLNIAELLLQKLKKNLKEKEIEFIVTGPLKEKIVELGYDPIFGAREMRRTIQDKVENVLAEAILSEKIKKGDRVEIESEKFKLRINP